MSKTEIEIQKAVKEYESADPKTKSMLERLFGKDMFIPKAEFSSIKSDLDVYATLKCDPRKDLISIDGFDEEQTDMVKAVIKKMRVCEAINGRKKLLQSEKRWFNWYRKGSSGSGLDFYCSHYTVDYAFLSSAARLSFFSEEALRHARENFPELDLNIIDLK